MNEKEELEKALDLLRDLADTQNGAPVGSDRKQWESVMHTVYDFLFKHEPQFEAPRKKTK